MDRIALTDTLSFSRLAYGMWRLGDDADTSPGHIQRKVEACLAQGITTLDQADIYDGYGAEELLGTALKAAPHLRDKIEIVTKCGIVAPVGRYADAPCKYYDTSASHIAQSVDTSLNLMGIEQIDLLLIHRPDPFMDAGDTGAALDAMVASGKVKAVGVSNFKPHDMDLLQSAMETPLVTNQIEASVLHLDPFTNGDIAYLQQFDIVPMAWSPLGGGRIFGNDSPALTSLLEDIAADFSVAIDAVAIAFLLAHPVGFIPVMGSNKLDRIAAFSDAFKVTLSRADWFRLYEASMGKEVP